MSLMPLRILNLLIIGLCNSSANCCFSKLIPVSVWVEAPADLLARVASDFLSKIYKSLVQVHADIYHVLFRLLAILNAFWRNTLWKAVILGNFLKSP